MDMNYQSIINRLKEVAHQSSGQHAAGEKEAPFFTLVPLSVLTIGESTLHKHVLFPKTLASILIAVRAPLRH